MEHLRQRSFLLLVFIWSLFVRKKRFSGTYPVMRLMYSSMRFALSSFMRSVT